MMLGLVDSVWAAMVGNAPMRSDAAKVQTKARDIFMAALTDLMKFGSQLGVALSTDQLLGVVATPLGRAASFKRHTREES